MYFWRFVCMCVLFQCGLAPVAAATLYIQPSGNTLGRGDAEIFQVRLDTDEANNECINAVSGVVNFTGPLTPIDISTGKSILSVWVEEPTIDEGQSKVSFAGGIPNGYCGRVEGDPALTNVLFEIIARANPDQAESAVATLSFSDQTALYLNDGFGTQAPARLLPSTVSIASTSNEFVADPWTERISQDQITPNEFSISLQRDELAFAGKYYITFNATDKETGIDRYEVMEEPLSQAGSFLWGRADAPWRTAVSPYVLEDQSLNSTIRVRAIDKAGNSYVATLLPDEEMRTISTLQLLTYLLIGAVVVLASVIAFVFSRRRRTRINASETNRDPSLHQVAGYDSVKEAQSEPHESNSSNSEYELPK